MDRRISEWNYTGTARMWAAQREQPEGYYNGRPIISRDTPVDGGVDIRSASFDAEAITLDTATHRDEYDLLYKDFLKEYETACFGSADTEKRAIMAAYRTVSSRMKYSEQSVGYDAKGREIDLIRYIRAGVGVCRHMSLASTWLLQEAYDKGLVDGWASSDANYSPGSSGHQWTRYTSPNGRVTIVDNAQNYIGSLERAILLRRWDYARPPEREALAYRVRSLRPLGQTLVKLGVRV